MTGRTIRDILLVGAAATLAAGSAALPRGAALRVSASSQCGTTDVSITQSAAAGTTSGTYDITLEVENFGPCNATNVVVVDTLPSNAGVSVTRTNPSSWGCTISGGSVSCLLGKLSSPGSSPTNPATATITLAIVAAGTSYTNVATVSADQSDPNPTNDTSWGGFPPAGGTIFQGPAAPTTSNRQTSSWKLPVQHSVQIQNAPTSVCAPLSSDCFGTTPLTITTLTTTGVQTFILNVDASLPGLPSFGQLAEYHLPDGSTQWVKLADCPSSGSVPVVGCVQSITRQTSAALVSAANPRGIYYQFVILTLTNGSWM